MSNDPHEDEPYGDRTNEDEPYRDESYGCHLCILVFQESTILNVVILEVILEVICAEVCHVC